MAYEIRKYDGTVLLTLTDGLSNGPQDGNGVTSLTFVGKNVSNFGKSQNENYLHLLENFANAESPTSEIRGQTWYDTDAYKLKVFNSVDWMSLAPIDYTDVQPARPKHGYLWFNTATNQLSINVATSGIDYRLIGPEDTPGYGTTKVRSEVLTATNNDRFPVVKIVVGDEVVGIFSTATFIPAGLIDGFSPQITRGLTLKNSDNSFPLNGRSFFSNLATTATNVAGGAHGTLLLQTSTGITTGLAIGPSNTVLYSNGSEPAWQSLSSLTISDAVTSTHVRGSTQGALVYQTGTNYTGFVPLGASGYILTAGASRPVWTNPGSMSVSLASTATHAIAADYASTATTQSVSDSSNNIATTEFVHSVMPRGVVLMWSGVIVDIPTGWNLCDGTNTTPDLRDRFIVGAGNTYDPDEIGGTTSIEVTIETSGTHSHGAATSSHALTDEQMPAHGHIFDDIRYMESNGATTYNDPMLGPIAINSRQGSASTDYDNGALFQSHGTYKAGGIDGVTQGHSHTITSDGSHAHTATATTIVPPYYALCYIMKTV